jgi:putative AlgH/UPF0301 family transcriptional regulator
MEAQEISTPILDDTLVSLAEQAEKRINAMKKIKQVSLKLTNRHDWTDQGGKPYLQVSGAEKIARMFGISWRISEPICEQQDGGHFSFTYKGYFSLAGATIEAIGTRNSKDGFFKKYDWSKTDEDGNSIKEELPASEIDRGDVKKAAFTNCIGNGIVRLLGLRNLTIIDWALRFIKRLDPASTLDLNSLTFDDLLKQLDLDPIPPQRRIRLMAGGPVENGRGFVLHTTDWATEGSLMVQPGLALTASVDILKAIAGGGGPREGVLALGYAGWGPGQLESEIQQNAWLSVPADERLLFGAAPDTLWREALAKLHIDPALLSSVAGRA